VKSEEISIARQLLRKNISVTRPNNGSIVERRCFLRVCPELCNEDLKQLELELRESLELVVGRIMTRKELGCAKKTSQCAAVTGRLLKIRCQDATSEDREDLTCPSDLQSV
jgi:hypothetical protein